MMTSSWPLGLRVIASFLAAGANISAPASAVAGTVIGCGTGEQVSINRVGLAAMAITTPLYVIQGSGKFFEVSLHDHHRRLISDHRFSQDMPGVQRSANKRWISYSGMVNGTSKTQYWLYDRQTKLDRLFFEHPAWGGGIPQFSPNGNFLAIAANYDKRWRSVRGAGIYVFDTATARMRSVKIPTTIAIEDAWADLQWSRGDDELLIMVRSVSVSNRVEYYSYRLSTGRIEKISGYYDSKRYEHVFTRNSQKVPSFEQVWPQSSLGLSSAFSPDRKWQAYLGEEEADMTYPLKVVGRDGVIKNVAVGRYDNCEGKSIHIAGWLDMKHFVYRYRSQKYFVAEADTGNTAKLFGENDFPLVFTW
jgi:hypothetical protein